MNKRLFSRSNVNSSIVSKPLRRKFLPILLSLTLLFASIPVASYAAISNPSSKFNVVTSTFYRIKNTLFPRPLFVGTLMTGSNLAGLPDRGDETASLATSSWTNLVTNLQTGNHLVTTSLLNVPTASGLPLSLQLAHNSMNASIDVGVGKGWMTNLHTCVDEDGQTGDITYMDPSGALYVFSYDSQTQTYSNPKGFAGKLTKEVSGEYTLQGLNHAKQVFGTNGKLTTVSEVCGTNPDTINIAYNGSGNPVSATDSLSGRAITLTWDANQKLSSINDPMSNTWSFTQNGSNQLTTITQPVDNSQTPPPTRPSTTFSYNANNLITGHDDFLGDSYTIGYEGSSPYKVTSWTDPASNVTSFSYAAATTPYDKKTTVTDAENIAVDYFFGATSKQLEKIEQTVSGTTLKIEMGYNATTGFQTTSKDSYGNTTTMAYDSVGHLTSVTPPSGQAGQYTQTLTYSTPTTIDSLLEESEETVTSQQNATTSISYTDANNPCLPTSITDPLDNETTIEYNSNGQPTSIDQPTTGGTKTTSIEYSPITGDPKLITDSIGNDTTFAYDLNGNLITVKSYEGDVLTGTLKDETDYTVNQVSAVLAEASDTTGQSSSVSLDLNGAKADVTSALGCVSSKSYKDSAQSTMPVGVKFKVPAWARGSIKFPTIPSPTFPGVPYDPLPASSTNSKNQTSTHVYKDNGALYTSTNYLGLTSTKTYDSFGRPSTVTNPYGKTTTYTLDLNNRPTSIQNEGSGTTTITYDNLGLTTGVTDPVKGNLSYSYNLRGETLTNYKGTYTKDLLGRTTAFAYSAGGTDSYSYNTEGYLTSFNNLSYGRNSIGQLTNWSNGMNGNGGASFNYTGTGSTALGMVGSMTGTGNVGSQSYTYDQKRWLASFTDTSKQTTPTFNYTYSSAKELTYLDYPNNLQLNQIYTAKNITSQTYTDTVNQVQFSSVSQSFTNDKLSSYSYSTKAGINTFSDTVTPSYVSTGAMKEKLDTLTYSGSGRVITCGYDANQGRLNSLKYSDIDPNNPFTLSYDAAGRMSAITDPNSQSVASYTYGANQGKLSMISYGNGNTANFTWNAKNKITNYLYTDNARQPASTKAYEVSYYDDGRPAGYSYTLDTVYQYEWKFYYSPAGLDKAEKWYYATQLIDIDTTVAPNGKVVSMTYQEYNCQTGSCYSGEASCIYDPCGNLTSIIDNATSTEVWARATDKNTNSTIALYNPYNMEIPIGGIGITNPIYDQPINGPIDIYISENGNWYDHVLIGNQAKLTTYTYYGNGVLPAMNGDDDCGEDPCYTDGNTPYKNCVANCMATGDTENVDTRYNKANHAYYIDYLNVKSEFENLMNYIHDKLVISGKTDKANWITGILISIGIGVLTYFTGGLFAIIAGVFSIGGTGYWLIEGNITGDEDTDNVINTKKQNFAIKINSFLHPGTAFEGKETGDLFAEFDDVLQLEFDCKSRCSYLLKGDTDCK